jgi:alpha-ketoglutarate-dependent taurine dioxygenase
LLCVDRDVVIEQFKTYGAVLFRSFSVGVEKFQELAKAYAVTRVPYPGRRRIAVSEDGMVQTVNIGKTAVPLHSELSHTPFRPDICWFYCVKAPKSGSATTLCDGTLVASSLPDSVRYQVDGRMLRYRMKRSPSFWEMFLGTRDMVAVREFLEGGPYSEFFRMEGDEVIQDFVMPFLHDAKFVGRKALANNIVHNSRTCPPPLQYPTFEDGSYIPENLIREIRDVEDGLTLEVRWRDEDLLMFDNTRFMHGRRRVQDPERTIWTQFTNANF